MLSLGLPINYLKTKLEKLVGQANVRLISKVGLIALFLSGIITLVSIPFPFLFVGSVLTEIILLTLSTAGFIGYYCGSWLQLNQYRHYNKNLREETQWLSREPIHYKNSANVQYGNKASRVYGTMHRAPYIISVTGSALRIINNSSIYLGVSSATIVSTVLQALYFNSPWALLLISVSTCLSLLFYPLLHLYIVRHNKNENKDLRTKYQELDGRSDIELERHKLALDITEQIFGNKHEFSLNIKRPPTNFLSKALSQQPYLYEWLEFHVYKAIYSYPLNLGANKERIIRIIASQIRPLLNPKTNTISIRALENINNKINGQGEKGEYYSSQVGRINIFNALSVVLEHSIQNEMTKNLEATNYKAAQKCTQEAIRGLNLNSEDNDYPIKQLKFQLTQAFLAESYEQGVEFSSLAEGQQHAYIAIAQNIITNFTDNNKISARKLWEIANPPGSKDISNAPLNHHFNLMFHEIKIGLSLLSLRKNQDNSIRKQVNAQNHYEESKKTIKKVFEEIGLDPDNPDSKFVWQYLINASLEIAKEGYCLFLFKQKDQLKTMINKFVKEEGLIFKHKILDKDKMLEQYCVYNRENNLEQALILLLGDIEKEFTKDKNLTRPKSPSSNKSKSYKASNVTVQPLLEGKGLVPYVYQV